VDQPLINDEFTPVDWAIHIERFEI